jgi:hypothetical protein
MIFLEQYDILMQLLVLFNRLKIAFHALHDVAHSLPRSATLLGRYATRQVRHVTVRAKERMISIGFIQWRMWQWIFKFLGKYFKFEIMT